MSTSTEYMDGLNTPGERRFYPRVTPPTPIYVAFGSNNLGVLHNVSENGLQVLTPIGLQLNSVFRVFLSLNGAPKTIAVTVRTIWSDSAEKRSGIQLLDLSEEDRAQIRLWVEFEMSRGENSTSWRSPADGERRMPKVGRFSEPPVSPHQDLGSAAAPPARAASSANVEPLLNRPLSNAEQRNGRQFNGAFVPKDRIASEPLPKHLREEVAKAASESGEDEVTNPTAQSAGSIPDASSPSASEAFEVNRGAAQPSEVNETGLPKIANPFEHPDPNSDLNSPFAKVPLPIHGEFEYAAPPSKQRRRATLTSRMRAKPLIIWAAILAAVCFGANALVRYKIKVNAQHYASESAKYEVPKSDASGPDSTTPVDDSGAHAARPSSTDAQSPTNADADANSAVSKGKSASQNGSPSNGNPPARTNAGVSEAAQESSLDARPNSAYTATAPTASDRSGDSAHTSQSATQSTSAPRSWSAPGPARSASSSVSASDTPQSPNVTSSADNAPVQSAPIVSQARPTPPPAPAVQPASTSNSSANTTTSTGSSGNANNQPARTQQSSSNAQSQSYASNSQPANTTPSRPQAQIYNANAAQQRSPIMGSINSVHSSGIFDSNDTTTANAAPPGASRSNGASASVATRPVSNGSVVQSDTPQDHDVEITAPKGFTASYVDIPGQRVVRTAAGTVRINRTVRVPGERLPGQRWLWKGRLNVTLGDVVSRIDPGVVQAAGASGSLAVQATIDKDGYVTDIKPLYGNFAMLPSVSRAVRNWHYDPTYLDNKRVETTAQVEFNVNATAATNRNAPR